MKREGGSVLRSIALGLALLCLAACSAAGGAPPAATGTPAAALARSASAAPSASMSVNAAIVASPLAGTYTKEIGRFSGRLLTGTYTMTFGKTGVTFQGPEGPPFRGGGVVAFQGVEITFGADEHCGPGQAVRGRYRWTLTGDTLAFTALDEGCQVRQQLLTDGDWQRQP
jgi:hypothetical protein